MGNNTRLEVQYLLLASSNRGCPCVEKFRSSGGKAGEQTNLLLPITLELTCNTTRRNKFITHSMIKWQSQKRSKGWKKKRLTTFVEEPRCSSQPSCLLVFRLSPQQQARTPRLLLLVCHCCREDMTGALPNLRVGHAIVSKKIGITSWELVWHSIRVGATFSHVMQWNPIKFFEPRLCQRKMTRQLVF